MTRLTILQRIFRASLLVVACVRPVGARAESPPSVPATDAFHAMGRGELVSWRAWGPEVFAEAQRRGLPVLLNLGTMWCHDCQRMSALTYSDPDVADLIHEKFVPLKIDADRHPELHARFVGAMRKIRDIGESVPFTGFLTGEGRLFVAAGYFAVDNDEEAGIAGIKTMLRAVDRQYQEDPRRYHNTAEEVANMLLQDALDALPPSAHTGLAANVASEIAAATDAKWGGIGEGGKAPLVPALLLMLEEGMRGNRKGLAFSELTLGAIADGGIRDLLGGGFHASTSDRQWRTPRFEKLATVNAGLLEYFALGAKLTGVAQYERTAGSTVDFVLDTLSDRVAGGIFQGQASDVPGAEVGSAYTWRRSEIEALLDGAEEKMAITFWGILEDSFALTEATKANVIAVRRDYADVLGETGLEPEAARKALFAAVAKLREARAKRPQPPVDRTMYAATNGLAAHGLLVAAALLDRADAREQALKSLDRFLAATWNDQTGFARGIDADGKVVVGDGLLADQVYLAEALVDAYEATGEQGYLDRAIATIAVASRRFLDPHHPGLFDIPSSALAGYSVLILPRRPIADEVVASENGVLALTLTRLGRLTGDSSYTDRADQLVRAVASRALTGGAAGATFARASSRLLAPAPQVIVVARARSAGGMNLAAAAWAGLRPGVSVRWVESRARLGQLYAAVAELPEVLREDFAIVVSADGKLLVATADPQEVTKALRPPSPKPPAQPPSTPAAAVEPVPAPPPAIAAEPKKEEQQ